LALPEARRLTTDSAGVGQIFKVLSLNFGESSLFLSHFQNPASSSQIAIIIAAKLGLRKSP